MFPFYVPLPFYDMHKGVVKNRYSAEIITTTEEVNKVVKHRCCFLMATHDLIRIVVLQLWLCLALVCTSHVEDINFFYLTLFNISKNFTPFNPF